MNSNIKKLLVAFLATMALFSLSGCGGDGENGTSSQTNLVVDLGGTPLVGVPHNVTVHVGNTAIIDSHTVAPTNGVTYTHTWTQTSGPSVAIVNGNTAVATVTPSVIGTAGLLHTVTNTATGLSTHTPVTVYVPTHTVILGVKTSFASKVPGGLPTTFHASVTGGTGSYTYSWVQDTGIPLTLDIVTHGFETPIVKLPLVPADELIEYTLTVTDSNGDTGTSSFSFTILAVPPFHASISTANVTYSGINFQGASLNCNASGGTKPYSYNWQTLARATSFVPGNNVKDPVLVNTNGNPGTFDVTVYCTVTDGGGLTKQVSTTITSADATP